MTWTTRIREAFDSAGRRIDDSVIEELAEHAADLEADLRQQGTKVADVEREMAAQIALWVREAPAHRSLPRSDPDVSPSTASVLSSLARELRHAVRG